MKEPLASIDPVGPAFEHGAADRLASRAVWPMLTALAVAFVACFVLGAVLVERARGGSVLVEPPVPTGSWRLEWSADVIPPAAEQAHQVRALRRVAAGTGGMVSLLALLISVGLWRQRRRLRRPEDFVHWAVGARRVQLAARLAGEGWRWGAVGVALSLIVVGAIAVIVEATFPGQADVPPAFATTLILATALTVAMLRWETRAGTQAARPEGGHFARLTSSATAVAMVGFAVLTGVGLLSRHQPSEMRASSARASSVAVSSVDVSSVDVSSVDAWSSGDRLVASVSLRDIPADDRAREISEWIERASGPASGVGIASAGTTRGAGHRADVWVECGECYEGGLPLPIRTVSTEIHAVAADTFPHMGLEVVSGRDFDNRLDRETPNAVIVSEALASRHFEGGDPIGRRVRFGDTGWVEVVGVVRDPRDTGEQARYTVYVALTQVVPADIEIFGRTDRETLSAVLAVAPDAARVQPPRTSAEVFAVHRWFARLMTVLGGLAYTLVVAGVWLAGRNEARATVFEVSLRKAVGARRRDLRRHFLSATARRLAIALGAGAWASLFLGAGLHGAYPTIPQIDWLVWGRAALLVSAAYVVGSWPSFARASRIPPVVGLSA